MLFNLRLFIHMAQSNSRSPTSQSITTKQWKFLFKTMGTFKLKVMNEFRPILNLMRVFNLENFLGTRKQVRNNIFKSIGFSLFLFVTPLTLFSDIWFCVNQSFNLDETALPISIFLYCSQLLLVIISIIFSNRLISTTLQRMEQIIAKSEVSEISFLLLVLRFVFICQRFIWYRVRSNATNTQTLWENRKTPRIYHSADKEMLIDNFVHVLYDSGNVSSYIFIHTSSNTRSMDFSLWICVSIHFYLFGCMPKRIQKRPFWAWYIWVSFHTFWHFHYLPLSTFSTSALPFP